MSMSDDELRALWRQQGGSFHGPNVETGTMPEEQLLKFLRNLIELPPYTIQVAADEIVFGGGTASYPKKIVNQATRMAGALYEALPDEQRAKVDADIKARSKLA